MHQLREVHWKASLQILSYLKNALSKGLHYRDHGHLEVTGYSDLGYARDRGDRKFISGYCTFVGGNLVIWRNKKQNVVFISSTEAEYKGVTNCASELLWLQSLLGEIGFQSSNSLVVLCDNISTTYLAVNPVLHSYTKHVAIDYHFV